MIRGFHGDSIVCRLRRGSRVTALSLLISELRWPYHRFFIIICRAPALNMCLLCAKHLTGTNVAWIMRK